MRRRAKMEHAVMPAVANRPATTYDADVADFAPGILSVHRPVAPLPHLLLRVVVVLLGLLLLWAIFGRLDIIATADGKLVPQSYLKIVQPADAGVIKVILVREGDRVKAGQVLMRMDPRLTQADTRTLQTQLAEKGLQLRRIDAELSGTPMQRRTGDPPELFSQVQAQYLANRQTYLDSVNHTKASIVKAQSDLAAAQQVQRKLGETLPTYQKQESAYDQLAKEGFAPKLMAEQHHRERVEKEDDLHAQAYTVASLQSAIAENEQQLASITSTYHSNLEKERAEAYADYKKLEQEWEKQKYHNSQVELRAPVAGIVKDLATHTIGTVVSPGTVIMTIVPQGDQLTAEVWVKNEDAGFVRVGQRAKIKFATFPFQDYGMADGTVTYISADASLPGANNGPAGTGQADGKAPDQNAQGLVYRSLVRLNTQYLPSGGQRYMLSPGMQLTAEINEGDRTVMEYLLSPVRKTFHEAGHER